MLEHPGGELVDLVGQGLSQVRDTRAGLAAILGLLVALWAASGYIAAFIRAGNQIYDIQEGRPFWKLRPLMLLVTLVLLLLVAAVALALVLTGPAATAVGNAIGIGSTAVTAWNIAKWPVIVALVALTVAILYWATPNVRQPKFRWMSLGSLIALVIFLLASLAFGFYVANFSSYNETYGALAAIVVVMLWLFLVAYAVIVGAELNAELERQTAVDSTTGAPAPLGSRGAHAADTVGRATGRRFRRGARPAPS